MAHSYIWAFPSSTAKQPEYLLYATALSSILIWLLIKIVQAYKTSPKSRAASSEHKVFANTQVNSFKKSERPAGVWIPMVFQRPAATPYLDWDIYKTPPLPYRPFKYGAYHVTMGLRSMQWDEWIELDNQYLEWHAIKSKRIAERGEKCCRTAPEAYDGAVELLEELFSYLSQRYPTLFTFQPPYKLTNTITHETFSLARPLSEDPMAIAARLVQDDLAIMFERSDGQYYLLAGSILVPGFWQLSKKFGMPLSEIHTSGNVPHFAEKLERGMMNFFRRVLPANPIVRHNYFFQVDNNLAWSTSLGSEDPPEAKGQHSSWADSHVENDARKLYFRSERQTLRRLPRTGGVVFTIRTYFEPIVKIAQEKGVPGRLASAIRSWGEETSRYKGKEKYEKALLDYLDEEHRKQVEKGEAESEKTYPF